MAYKKPVSVVKVTPTVNTKPVIRYDLGDIEEQDGNSEARVLIKYKSSTFTLYFLYEALPYCCGVVELGDFEKSQKGTEIDKELITSCVKSLIAQAIEGINNTCIINLINNPACNIVKEALEDNELFTLVKEFKNSNSNNKITMYISNN